MINRAEIKATAKEQIKGKIGVLFVMALIVFAITFVVSLVPIVGGLAQMLFAPAFTLGFAMVFLAIAAGEKPRVGDVFNGFPRWGKAFWLEFLKLIFSGGWLLIVWSGVFAFMAAMSVGDLYSPNYELVASAPSAATNILMVIGLCAIGIIVFIRYLRYALSTYILAENENMTAREAITESVRLMRGRLSELFVLGLSFILWFLLATITFGIATIYVWPYFSATMVNYYNSVKTFEV
ncbi:MAG: DUF975 family protein [Clostridiales bacterium]|jgi:uncharacterized membrane protein|nr:DUF975 family protein [Clostridiales bacterium]